MDGFNLLKDWLALILSMIALGTIATGWFTAGGKKALTALDEYKIKAANDAKDTDKRIDGHETRIGQIENELAHLPGKDELTELKLEIARMSGEVGKFGVMVGALQKSVNRIEQYLDSKKD